MVDRHIVQHWGSFTRCNQCEDIWTVEFRSIDVIKDYVVNAVTPAIQRNLTSIGTAVADLHSRCHVADVVVTYRDIGHLAYRACAIGLRRQQNRESHLREATPGIFHDVAFQ